MSECLAVLIAIESCGPEASLNDRKVQSAMQSCLSEEAVYCVSESLATTIDWLVAH